MRDGWEGGERQGIRWRRAGLVVLVVVVVAGGVYAVRRERGIAVDTGGTPVAGATQRPDIVLSPPTRLGTRWYCPEAFPVHVDAHGRYFPKEYPRGERPDERPEICYADARRAELDGYTLAAPPPGTTVAGGVYLEHVSTPSIRSCRALASAARFAVPCPTLLPTPAIGPSCLQDSCMYGVKEGEFINRSTTGVVIEQREFSEPPGWPASSSHVVISAARIRTLKSGEVIAEEHPELVSCGAHEPVVAPFEPLIRDCPDDVGTDWVPRIQGDPHKGHTAAFWRRGPAAYAVSVEGYGPEVRDLLDAVMDGIRYVGD